MVPDPDDQSPAIALRMEVLPAPLGPTISSDAPAGTCAHTTLSVAEFLQGENNFSLGYG